MTKKKSYVSVKKGKKKLASGIQRDTMSGLRKVIADRLTELGKSKRWLSREIGTTSATIFKFFGGKTTLRMDLLERVLDALNLEVKPKD